MRSSALALFTRQGYDNTTVAEIAAAAGVTQMTFFRHFPVKERVLLEDPYDPLIAAAIGRQSCTLRPLERVVAGLRSAWGQLPQPDTAEERLRLRVAASTDSLRAAVWRNNAETERVIVDQLVQDGTDPTVAHIAAAAALAAVMASLLEWAQVDESTIGAAVLGALDVLVSPAREVG